MMIVPAFSRRQVVLLSVIVVVGLLPLLWHRLPITTPTEAAEYFPEAKRWFLALWLTALALMVTQFRSAARRVLLAAVLTVLLPMAVMPPLGSGDAYSSVVRSVSVDLQENPFTTLPHGPLVRQWLPGTWRNYATPYGPFWHDLPGWFYRLSGQNLFSSVRLLQWFGLLTVVALMTVASRFTSGERLAACLPLLPLVAFETANNAHPDGLMILFLLVAALLARDGRWLTSALAFVLALAVKPIAILGFVVMKVFRWPHAWRWVLTVLAAGVLVVLPYLCHGGVLAGVTSYAGFMETHTVTPFVALVWPGADVLVRFFAVGDIRAAVLLVLRAMAGGLLILVSVQIIRKDREAVRLTILPFLVFVLVFPFNLQPWYGLWFLPLLLVASRPVVGPAVAAIVAGHAVAYLTYSSTGGAFVTLGLFMILYGRQLNPGLPVNGDVLHL